MTTNTLRRAGILAMGMYVPEKILSNEDLESLLDTTSKWIIEKLGIHQRRIAADDENTSDLAVHASLRALKKAGLSPDDIDLVLVGTNTPDNFCPAMSSLVIQKLGASNAVGLDIRAGGCPSGVYSLVMGEKFIASRTYDTVLVVNAELNTRLADWEDRRTAVFFGDGAAAAILRPIETERGIIASKWGLDPSGYYAAYVPAGGSAMPFNEDVAAQRLQYFQMDGRAVWEFGSRIIPQMVDEILDITNLELADVNLVITHQANVRLIRHAAKSSNIPSDKVYINADRYGNTGGASVPLALCEAVDTGQVQPGDRVILAGFGAGLAWGSIMVQWADPKEFSSMTKN
jgi:3-oxoacyl-[acyl-carrier-protein] synthase-3